MSLPSFPLESLDWPASPLSGVYIKENLDRRKSRALGLQNPSLIFLFVSMLISSFENVQSRLTTTRF